MSETSAPELMVLVERVVRPLQIPLHRQKRVRDELLHHLQTIYAEELEIDGDSAKALIRTQQRFGNPATLTAEIRNATCWSDRWQTWVQHRLKQGSTESLPSYVARLAAVIICPIPLCIAMGMIDHHFFGTVRYSPRDIAIAISIVVALYVWMSALLAFVLQAGIEWDRPQRRWSRIAYLSLAHLASWPINMMIIMLIADGSWSQYSNPLLASVLLGAVSAICGGILGARLRRETVYCQKWAELDLESA